MRLSNFVFLTQAKNASGYFFQYADVDVTTGSLWWKKTSKRRAYKRPCTESWLWLEDGSLAPVEIGELADAAYARKLLNNTE